MAKQILLKRSNKPDNIPSVDKMEHGELFINFASGHGKSFLTTLKSDKTRAQFMEKEYNDAHYADKEFVDNLEMFVEENAKAISGLTNEIIETERVIAVALNTINQSAGFDENGNSTLGMSLTDAIKEIQDNNGGSKETLDGLQDQIDGLQEQIDGFNDSIDNLTNKVDNIENSIDNFVTNGELSTLTEKVDKNTEDIKTISGNLTTLQGNVGDIQNNLDNLQGSVDGFQGELDNVGDQVSNLSTKVDEIEGNLNTLTGEVETRFSAITKDITDLQNKDSELEGSITDLQDDVDGLENKVDTAISDLTDIINTKISSVYTFKDSVLNYDELEEITDKKTGDVYNVENEVELSDGSFYPAGTNFAWDGEKWDALGGIVDLSNYATIEMVNTLQGEVDNISSDYVGKDNFNNTIDDINSRFDGYATTAETEGLSTRISGNTNAITEINNILDTLQENVDKLGDDIESNSEAISGLTNDLEEVERVVAITLNTMNQSAGFDENGNSTLDGGQSLSDAIKDLQVKDKDIIELISDIQDSVDEIGSDYVTSTDLNDAISGVNSKFDNYTTTAKTEEISNKVVENTNSITEIKNIVSGISDNIVTIQSNIDDLSSRVEINEGSISNLTSDFTSVNERFSAYTLSSVTEEIISVVSANTDAIVEIKSGMTEIQAEIDDTKLKVDENEKSISELTSDLEEVERVVAITINTINQSAGFDENGNSTLDDGQSLTDGIKELQTKHGELEGTMVEIQDNIDSISESVEENNKSISGLTEELIKTERVIANALNTMNQSAGFDENGNCTLDKNLTESIEDLQIKNGEIEETMESLQNDIDDLNSRVETNEGNISDLTNRLSNYTLSSTTNEIITVVSANSNTIRVINESISAINGNVITIQGEVDNVNTKIDNAVSSLTQTINEKIASAYIYRGTTQKLSDLPTTGNTEGDVWNVASETEINGEKYPAGTNFAWVAPKEEGKDGHWDALGGIVDLSEFATTGTTSDLQEQIDNLGDVVENNGNSISALTEELEKTERVIANTLNIINQSAGFNENGESVLGVSLTEAISGLNINVETIIDEVSEIHGRIDNIENEVEEGFSTLTQNISALTENLFDVEFVVAQSITTMNESAGFDENGKSTLESGQTLTDGIKENKSNIATINTKINELEEKQDNIDSEIGNIKYSISALTQDVIDNEEVITNAITTIIQSTGLNEDGSSPLNKSLVDAIIDLQNAGGGSPDTINGILEDIDNLESDVDGIKNSVSALTQEVIDNEEVISHVINTINESAGFDQNGNSVLGMSLTDAIKDIQEEMVDNEFVTANALATFNQSAGFDENGYSTLGKSLTDAIVDLQDKTTTYVTNSTGTFYIVGADSNTTGEKSLYMHSDIYASGGELYSSSDKTLKTHIGEIEIDLEKLRNLPKVYFYWNNDEEKRPQMGTYAQNVQELFPEIVIKNEDTGKLGVAYEKLSVIALAAIDKLHEENKKLYDQNKELEEKYNKQEKKINDLEEKINSLLNLLK